MRRTVTYITLAIILGLAMILIPTWFFLANTPKYYTYTSGLQGSSSGRLPLLEYELQNHIIAVSFREVGILGFSFIVALGAYVWIKRKTSTN